MQLDSRHTNKIAVFKLIDEKNLAELNKFLTEQADKSFLFDVDSVGNTVLHQAVEVKDYSILFALITHLKDSDNFSNLINRSNLIGNTALHVAFKYSRPFDFLTLLIQYGTHLNAVNNDQDSLCDLFQKISIGGQIELFNAIAREKLQVATLQATPQEFILEHYRQQLIQNPNQKNIRSIYFKLAGLHSLRKLAGAHKEFGVNKKILKQETKLNITDSYFNEILNIPHYTQRLNEFDKKRSKAQKKLNNSRVMQEELHEFSSIESYVEQQNPSIINQDRATLNKILKTLDDFDKRLSKLRKRPAIYYFFVTLTWLAIITLIVLPIVFKKALHNKKGVVFSSLFGAAAVLITCCITACLSDHERRLSKKEWESILDLIQNELLSKLQYLRKKDKIEKSNYLPITVASYKDLKTVMRDLGSQDNLLHSDLRSRVEELANRTKMVRSEINLSGKPFSLFTHQIIPVEIADKDNKNVNENVNERTYLLQNK